MLFFPCLKRHVSECSQRLGRAILWLRWMRLQRMWVSDGPSPETNRRRYHRSSGGVVVRGVLHFSKSFLGRCLEKREALDATAEEHRRGAVKDNGRDYGHNW
jgi:hypothetical protein